MSTRLYYSCCPHCLHEQDDETYPDKHEDTCPYGCNQGGRVTEIRGNSVRVAKIFQARCTVPGCDWAGELLASYQEANGDRQAHLAEHRAAAGE